MSNNPPKKATVPREESSVCGIKDIVSSLMAPKPRPGRSAGHSRHQFLVFLISLCDIHQKRPGVLNLIKLPGYEIILADQLSNLK